MELLKEQDLLNWFEEMNIKDIDKDTREDRHFEIHYWFNINGLKFSIISWEQYSDFQKKEYQEMGLKMEENANPMWEIYCFNVDNDIKRTKNLNDFKKFIDECYEMANKN